MSVTLRRTWQVDGVYTDVTSIVLSNPGGTVGIQRNDTGAVLDDGVAGTPMSKVDTGIYEYVFEEPLPGLTYTAYIQIVYDGTTRDYIVVVNGAGGTSISAQGAYISLTDVTDVFGIDNVSVWLHLGASDTDAVCSARALKIIQFAESFVNSWFRRSRYAVPFDPCPLEIVEICCYIAGSKMYEPRTTDDYSGDNQSPLKTFVMAKRKAAMDTIKNIISGKIIMDAPTIEGLTEVPVHVRCDSMVPRQVRRNEISLDELANITFNSDGSSAVWP